MDSLDMRAVAAVSERADGSNVHVPVVFMHRCSSSYIQAHRSCSLLYIDFNVVSKKWVRISSIASDVMTPVNSVSLPPSHLVRYLLFVGGLQRLHAPRCKPTYVIITRSEQQDEGLRVPCETKSQRSLLFPAAATNVSSFNDSCDIKLLLVFRAFSHESPATK